MAEPRKGPLFIAALGAASAAVSVGTTLGWSNPAEVDLKFGSMDFAVSDEMFSWAASVLLLFAAAFCVPSLLMLNKIGRKVTMLILVVPLLVGHGFLSFASQMWVMYLARALQGISVGGYWVCVPLYIGEIATANLRGTLIACFQLMLSVGILMVFIIGAFLGPRMLDGVLAAFPILSFLMFLFLPESPTHYIHKGKEERAVKSIKWLRGKDYEPMDELEEYWAAEAAAQQRGKMFKDPFAESAAKRALWILIGLTICQQLSGINGIVFYSTEVFRLGSNTLEPRFSTIILGAVLVLAMIFAVVFAERLPRRATLLVTTALSTLCIIGLGIYGLLFEANYGTVEPHSYVPLLTMSVYLILFAFGLGTIPWLMLNEVFAPDVKGPAGSIIATVMFLFAFIVTKSYISIKDEYGFGEPFLVFGFLSVIALLFIGLFVPETKGKSFKEIQGLFEKEKNRGNA